MVKAIITGGRGYTVTQRDLDWLAEMIVLHDITEVLHGACPTGADTIVGDDQHWWNLREQCAPTQYFAVVPYPADWRAFGKAAGPKRNQQMVDACVPGDFCLHWPGGAGTFDCMSRARKAGLTLIAAHTRHESQAAPETRAGGGAHGGREG